MWVIPHVYFAMRKTLQNIPNYVKIYLRFGKEHQNKNTA